MELGDLPPADGPVAKSEAPVEDSPDETFEEISKEGIEDESKTVKTISISPIPTSAPPPIFTFTGEDAKTKHESVNVSCLSLSSTSSSVPICRICHDTEDEKGDTKLVAPCGCTGSAEFTHKKCLQKWTNVKGATTCEICNQGYKPKYILFRHKLLTRQVMCMGSAASLPLLVVIIVGFFLLGEQLSLGNYDLDEEEAKARSNTSKIMVSVCMIGTATFGIFLLCCFSVWAAKVQPQHIEGVGDDAAHGHDDTDVESGVPRNSPHTSPSHHRAPVPMYFF